MEGSSNITLMKQLYSKFADTLAIGSSSAVANQNYLSLCSPGIFLDPNLNPEKDENAQYVWSNLLDAVPAPNWIYASTGESLETIYRQILESRELPDVELTKQQLELLAKARAVVMTDEEEESKKYRRFLKYESEYLDALTALQLAQTNCANSGGGQVPPATTSAYNRALSAWSTFGFKGEVEGAMATIASLQQRNVDTWWSQLEAAYGSAKRTGSRGGFEVTSTYPEYPSLVGSEGWTHFTFSETDLTNQTTSSTVEAGGGGGAGWGLWHASASANYKKDEGESSSTTSGISISMEIMRASIMRSWLDPLVFRAHSWRFGTGMPLYGQQISTGSFIPGEKSEGLMPMLPTGILVARNVQISAQFSQKEEKTVETALETKGSIGWGPFAINGHYNQSSSSDFSAGQISSGTIANADPQIIGFLCDVLPLCPSPDPTLPWASAS